MQIDKKSYAAICLSLLLVVACKQSPSDKDVSEVAAEVEPAAVVHTTPTTKPAAATAPAPAGSDTGVCSGALDAIGSCALAKVCDEDIGMYLPAASRDALLALEKSSSYSAAAFDRYCLSACKARSGELDENAFSQEVCGAPAASSPTPVSKLITASSFSLHGKLEVSTIGLPLAEITQKLGEPTSKRDSRYDCGSAFDEGTIQEYLYADFTLETDGEKAVVRSLQLANGNRLKLSNGQSFASLDEAQFKSIFGPSVQRFGEVYRISAATDGSLETAFDFHFDATGRLVRIDYWIAC